MHTDAHECCFIILILFFDNRNYQPIETDQPRQKRNEWLSKNSQNDIKFKKCRFPTTKIHSESFGFLIHIMTREKINP